MGRKKNLKALVLGICAFSIFSGCRDYRIQGTVDEKIHEAERTYVTESKPSIYKDYGPTYSDYYIHHDGEDFILKIRWGEEERITTYYVGKENYDSFDIGDSFDSKLVECSRYDNNNSKKEITYDEYKEFQ